MIDLSSEIRLQTTRSGGKGGQNVNKVETAVIAFFDVAGSLLLSEKQKGLVHQKLGNRINSEGQLVVKAQMHRTQLANKEEAVDRINELIGEAIRKVHELIEQALKKKKMRIGTKPSKKSREKRLESKKKSSEVKQGRKKLRPGDI